MIWNSLFGSMYGESPYIVLATGWSIIYNDYNLQTDYIVTNKITVDNFPSVDYEDFNLPRADWMWFLSKFYRSRNIEITWFLKHNTELDLQNLIDELKMNLSKTNWIFKYITNSEYRQILANCIDVNIPKDHYNITLVPFTIQLKTLESYFYLVNNISIVDSWTNSPRTIQINNLWSAVSLPQVYLTFTWISWTNSVAFNLWNRTLTYTWTISNWDILLFDCLNKQVTKNGVLVEYSWTFTELSLWINSLIFTINWTFTCNYIISYRKNFL